MSRPTLVLIDGHALAYRQFFAIPVGSFSTRAGEPTNATYGFLLMLNRVLEKFPPDFVAMVSSPPLLTEKGDPPSPSLFRPKTL